MCSTYSRRPAHFIRFTRKPCMSYTKKQLAEMGIPAAQTGYEFFGPAGALD